MTKANICLFVYDFPHRKSTDFLTYLYTNGFSVGLVIGAPFKKLKPKPPGLRTKVRSKASIHPKDLAEAFSIPYVQMDHNDPEIRFICNKYACNIGVIAGARILKQSTIDCFEFGIVNIHPGILPDIRGLDAVLWAIKDNKAWGVTAHLIDSRVDAGQLLLKHLIDLHDDDTLFDISERLYTDQVTILAEAIKKAMAREYMVSNFDAPCRTAMSLDEAISVVSNTDRLSDIV